MKHHLLPFALLAILGALPLRLHADAGHDHGATAQVVTNSNAPQRLPDGSVALPKHSQRQLAVRTQVVVAGRRPQSVVLAGTVVMDPNAGGKVQPTVAGRIEPGPRGLPRLGQTVKRGEVLAYVRPSSGAIERANQSAQAAELRANRTVAEKRLARVQQLEGTVPQKDIEAAQAEVQALTERLTAVGGSLSSTESLIAPVTGIVASASVVAGQVVDAREVLFEIVDPRRLQVEAIAHDTTLATRVTTATAAPQPGTSLPLVFVGAGRSLREQALPILFRFDSTTAALPSLSLGQPITVLVQTDGTVEGFAVPTAAIVKDRNNQDIVWVHTEPERFVPKVVRHVPLDGATSALLDGVTKGDRVVTEGASLLNQVR